jgi:hypothetical protein
VSKLALLLTGFNTLMECVVLPWKIKREEGGKYNDLQFSTIRTLQYADELKDLNSPFISDAAKAEAIVKGMRRWRTQQKPLVETA